MIGVTRYSLSVEKGKTRSTIIIFMVFTAD